MLIVGLLSREIGGRFLVRSESLRKFGESWNSEWVNPYIDEPQVTRFRGVLDSFFGSAPGLVSVENASRWFLRGSCSSSHCYCCEPQATPTTDSGSAAKPTSDQPTPKAPAPAEKQPPSRTTGQEAAQAAPANPQPDQPPPKKPKTEEGNESKKGLAEVSGAADQELVTTLADPPGKIMLIKSQPPSLQLVSESAANRRLAKNFLFKMWKAML